MMDSTTSEPVLVHSTFAYQTIRTKLFRLRHEQCCDGEVDGSCGERSAKRRKAVLVSPELIKRFEDKTKRMEVLVKVASEEVQIEGGNNESGVAISMPTKPTATESLSAHLDPSDSPRNSSRASSNPPSETTDSPSRPIPTSRTPTPNPEHALIVHPSSSLNSESTTRHSTPPQQITNTSNRATAHGKVVELDCNENDNDDDSLDEVYNRHEQGSQASLTSMMSMTSTGTTVIWIGSISIPSNYLPRLGTGMGMGGGQSSSSAGANTNNTGLGRRPSSITVDWEKQGQGAGVGAGVGKQIEVGSRGLGVGTGTGCLFTDIATATSAPGVMIATIYDSGPPPPPTPTSPPTSPFNRSTFTLDSVYEECEEDRTGGMGSMHGMDDMEAHTPIHGGTSPDVEVCGAEDGDCFTGMGMSGHYYNNTNESISSFQTGYTRTKLETIRDESEDEGEFQRPSSSPSQNSNTDLSLAPPSPPPKSPLRHPYAEPEFLEFNLPFPPVGISTFDIDLDMDFSSFSSNDHNHTHQSNPLSSILAFGNSFLDTTVDRDAENEKIWERRREEVMGPIGGGVGIVGDCGGGCGGGGGKGGFVRMV